MQKERKNEQKFEKIVNCNKKLKRDQNLLMNY